MNIVLAPMDGLTDPIMRAILTQIGGFDWCVSEFIRISNSLLPNKIFYEYSPELLNNGKTPSGTPVHIQLLGSDAQLMAENACKAAELGAPAIDLNFGCPAKTVNKHRGGAILLDEPEALYSIIQSVRKAVPAHIPVSAKMRLGYMDDSKSLDNLHAVQQAGASWLTIHARTKADGYAPPAYWHKIKPLQLQSSIPIIANGEIWSVEDAVQCQQESGCTDIMLGRGAIRFPDLANQILKRPRLQWPDLCEHQLNFLNATSQPEHLPKLVGRYKQWLGLLSEGHQPAKTLWHLIKKEKDIQVVREHIVTSLLSNP